MVSVQSAVVHFLILTWCLKVQATGQVVLDMADTAFDDQYLGCTEEMEEKAPQLLKEELEANENFKIEWRQAASTWKYRKNNTGISKKLNDYHGTALMASTEYIGVAFNRAVREFYKNPHDFKFKAFHYYLTRALQLLNQRDCYTVYTRSVFAFQYSGRGNVRFGKFTLSSLSKRKGTRPFYITNLRWTVFEITTCLGVPIKEYSYYPSELEVLIPGYEVYQKVNVTQKEKYIEIKLENPKTQKSTFNCFFSSLDCSDADCYYRSSGTREAPALPVLLPGLLVLLLPAEE